MIKRIIYSLAPVIGGAIVGLIISGYMDYQDIIKPPLSPPSLVFPIVWTILYILMGISYFLATKDDGNSKELDQIYLLQLLVNFLWPIIFFVLKMYFTAFLWIILLLILCVYDLALLCIHLIIHLYKFLLFFLNIFLLFDLLLLARTSNARPYNFEFLLIFSFYFLYILL